MVAAVDALLRKELQLELRNREAIPAMLLFSITTFVVFHFGLQRDSVDGPLAAGVLWVTILFAAMLGANRLFVAETEGGALDGLLLAPIDRTAIYVAKALAFAGFLAAVQLVAVPGVLPAAAGARRRRCGARTAGGAGTRRRRDRRRGDARSRIGDADAIEGAAGVAAGAAAAAAGHHRRRQGDRAAVRERRCRRDPGEVASGAGAL